MDTKFIKKRTETYRAMNSCEFTKKYIKEMLSDQKFTDLYEYMCKPLCFSTGGMRSTMNIGFSCINPVTVNLLASSLSFNEPVYIGYDGRYNSRMFALIFCEVLEKHVKTFIFDKPIITPILAFYKNGVMITASHNTQEYNGIKIYCNGSQITTPIDTEIEQKMRNISLIDIEMTFYEQAFFLYLMKDIDNHLKLEAQIFEGKKNKLNFINIDDTFNHYYESLFSSRLDFKNTKNINVFFSGLHGPCSYFMKKACDIAGIKNVFLDDLDHIDPTFGNYINPDPEKNVIYERVLTRNKKLISEENIQYIMLTDGDGDRFGFAQIIENKCKIFDAEEIATIILFFLSKIENNICCLNTMFCSDFIKEYSKKIGVTHYSINSTGFKFLMLKVNTLLEKHKVIFAYEDSYGFCLNENEKGGLHTALLVLHIIYNYDVNEIISLARAEVGCFVTFKMQLKTSNKSETLNKIVDNLKINQIDVKHLEETDGYEVLNAFNVQIGLFFRASGTEPIIKVYSKGSNILKEELEKYTREFVKKYFIF